MKLKPCPNILCGNSEIEQLELVQEHSNNEDVFYYQCTVCGCVPIGESNSRKKAKEMWNNRPTEKAFEAHAVEVLFKYISRHHEMTEEKEKAMRTEARQLLGWEE